MASINEKQKRKNSHPIVKKWYHWHYVTGIVFGLFCSDILFQRYDVTGGSAGMDQQTGIGQEPTREIKKGAPKPDQYLLDYRQILTEYPDVRQVEWSNFRSKPYYIVKTE